MIAGVIPSETAQEHVRNSLALLSLSRHGNTATGQPARILTREEFDSVTRRLQRVVEQLEQRERASVSQADGDRP